MDLLIIDSGDGLVAPKYRTLDSRLQSLTQNLGIRLNTQQHISYEIVVLEVKKLQLPGEW
jgi:hypothetical protein